VPFDFAQGRLGAPITLQALNAFCRWLHENGDVPARIERRPLKLQKRLLQTLALGDSRHRGVQTAGRSERE
jgi:hypothetical protein